MNILVMTALGKVANGNWIDYFPSRWSYTSGKQFKSNAYYPFHLAYLSTYLKAETNHQVKMVDANYYGVDIEEYVEIVLTLAPDVLVIEVDYIIARRQLTVVKILRDKNFKGKIIFCGPLATVEPEYILKNGVDYAIIGEFEQAVLDLVKSDFSGADIKGVYPNKEHNVVDVNRLPFPENDDIKRRHYNRIYGLVYKQVEAYATRGCFHSCDFCVAANNYYFHHHQRTRDINSVIAEIKYLRNEISELEGIFFHEETHVGSRKYTSDLCDAIIKSGLNNLRYTCMTNYNTLDYDLLKKMSQAGYHDFRIGVENLSRSQTNTQTDYMKKQNAEKLLQVLKWCRELGIKIYATIAMGALGATYEDDLWTLDELARLHSQKLIQEISVSACVPMKGTPFYEYCEKNGYLTADLTYDGKMDASVNFPWYSATDIKKALTKAIELSDHFYRVNEANGVKYISKDKEWCKEVFATTHRKPGEGIL